MLLNTSLPSHPKTIHRILNRWPSTKRSLFMALMAALAAILQSAGGLLPAIGFVISPFATAPIMIATFDIFAFRGFHLSRNNPFVTID